MLLGQTAGCSLHTATPLKLFLRLCSLNVNIHLRFGHKIAVLVASIGQLEGVVAVVVIDCQTISQLVRGRFEFI